MVTHNIDNTYTGFLGNRIFQAASLIGIATKNNMEWGFTPNDYLGCFKGFKPELKVGTPGFVNITEAGFGYTEVKLSPGKNYNILGYRQSYLYWQHCEDKIREVFSFNEGTREAAVRTLSEIKTMFPGRQLVSVHFRFGDYLNLKEHHTCLSETKFYANAQLLFQDAVFVVFSDDMQKAMQYMNNIADPSNAVCSGATGSPTSDMCLMTLLDGHIIANSSFSFWGAYLSRQDKVIAPDHRHWFGPAYNGIMKTDDILLPEWTQVSC